MKNIAYYNISEIPSMINSEVSAIMRIRLQKMWPVIYNYIGKYDESCLQILERSVLLYL